MRLKTEDLLVRNFRDDDLEALHAIYSDADVMEYMGGPFEDIRDTEDEMEFTCLGSDPSRFAVVLSRTGRLIGEVTFIIHEEEDMKGECEIGWVLAKDCWNRGYARQLTAAMMDEAAARGAKAVFLCCEEEQEIPKHIAGEFGMEYMGLEWGQLMYRKEL